MITLRPGSHAYRLLLLLAICGEYPHRSLHLLGSIRTLEELVRRLEVVQHFRTPAGRPRLLQNAHHQRKGEQTDNPAL